jgi:hypothetical protein
VRWVVENGFTGAKALTVVLAGGVLVWMWRSLPALSFHDLS